MPGVPSRGRTVSFHRHQPDAYETAAPERKTNLTLGRRAFSQVLIASASTSTGLALGCRHRERFQVRVRGSSMNPTLWGHHRLMVCQSCRVETRVDESIIAAHLEKTTHGESRCWHCGGVFTDEQIRTSRSFNCDTISISTDQTDDARSGDLIVYRNDNRGLSLKRILGRPGDQIDRSATGKLLNVTHGHSRVVSSHPPAPIPIDFDDHRCESRWDAMPRGPKRNVIERSKEGEWSWPRTLDSSVIKLQYQHRNVHRDNRAISWSDDRPGNIGLSRQLYPIDQIRLTALIRFCDQNEWQPWQHACDVLDPKGRVAIRFDASKIAGVKRLRIDRPVASVDHRTDHASRYPIRLASDEWFVVGDNPPTSIDSRQLGPIKTSQIVGVSV
ncbi:MAG: S26 family signal peptidase [Planctomycetota bacterium]